MSGRHDEEGKVERGPWRLQLLGPARLWVGESAVALSPVVALVLGWLALEGPTPRARLAALLWPDSPDATARNNLRQLLRRVRLACAGAEPIEETESLQLASALPVDAREVQEAARAGRHAQVLAAEGELLAGVHAADNPELEQWLERMRVAVDAWREKARAGQLAQREAAGALQEALGLAQAWAQRAPASEEAGRAVMRLHYLLGNRTEALAAYARLEQALVRELDVSPLPETRALARHIGQGAPLPGPRPRPALPLSVARPPRFVGREEAWRQLEEGWEAGQLLFIVGEPGVGKSRLATEFAESRGRWALIEGRVGDRGVPYATLARSLRVSMAAHPEVRLPAWVRRELQRVVPELAEAAEPAPPLASEADLLRLYDAAAEATRLFMQGYAAIVSDDAQDNDAASLLMGASVFSRHFPLNRQGAIGRYIVTYRSGSDEAGWRQHVQQLVDAGAARLIELAPLSAHHVRELLEGVEVPGAERHAERIARYTGGNPLYVVETLKHLVETGALAREWPEHLPPPGRVGPLIQRRLEQLRPEALRLARVAALARTHFTFPLAARVLEVGTLEVGEAAVELEAAQVLSGERFTHDLVHEAVTASIPATLRQLLHLRLAEELERTAAPPGVVAHHWLEARAPQRALPFLLEAARLDAQALLFAEAAARYARAGQLLAEAGQHEAAREALAHAEDCRQRAAAPSTR